MNLAPIRKAVAAAAGAAVTALLGGLGEPLVVHHALHGGDVATAVGLALVAAAGVGKVVHAVPNVPPRRARRASSTPAD